VADETTNSTMSGAGSRDETAGADQVVIRPPIEVVVVDADSLEIINSNAAAQRHMGFGDGIAGPTMADLAPAFSRERAGVALGRLRDGLLDELVVETRMRAVDGSLFPVEAHVTYVADPTPRYVAMMLDISARKASDERTERLERLREALAELLRAITRIGDRDELYLEACRIAVERGGFRMAWIGLVDRETGRIVPVASAGHVAGYLEILRLSVHDLGAARGMTAAAIQTGRPVVVRDGRTDPMFAQYRDDASARGYHSAVALPLIVEGRPIGALIVYATLVDAFGPPEVELMEHVAEDISFKLEVIGREEIRAAAEAERDRLAAVVEQAAEIVIITGQDSRIAYANPAFTRLSGYEPGELIGQTPEFLRGRLLSADVGPSITSTLARGLAWSGRTNAQNKDGSHREIDLSVSLRHDDAGRIVGSTIIGRDVSRERSLEAQLFQSQKIEAIGRFAGGIAHDFNNLLTAISGYAEILQAELEPSDPRSDDVSEIQKAAKRATALTAQLLAFSRRQVLQPRPLDPRRVIDDLAPMLRRLIGEDVELICRAAPGLGPILADPGQLDTVLINLALNARDAMPGGGRLVIEAANADLDEAFVAANVGSRLGPHVEIAVGDTGTGMSVATMERAFEPFFTTKGPGKGTGLGLSTVLGIVEQSDGFVRVESEPGHGSTFRIYLPRTARGVALPAAVPEPRADRDRPTGTVLVAEDEATVRSLVQRVLEEAGYRVLAAVDGHQAIELSGAYPGRIDLLFTDVVMPGMSGRELAERLVAQRPGTPVLFASGYNEEMVAQRAALDPAIQYLGKPYTAMELLDRIHGLLDGGVGRK